ncbi:TonB-dependent receptor domain-containing protein [Sphingobium sp. SCG-1]|uniref:TonB-dependent receptor domain-containing protein n=1 Tax=Sphingobium sp. SCG-1 TaxID=2072936 RepID=UPI0016713A7A|nr:TonB-dependent receptor [Sphingobium sp. SCG-1]
MALLANIGRRDSESGARRHPNNISRQSWITATALALTATATVAAPLARAAEAAATTISLPAGPLDVALLELSSATSVAVAVDPALVGGRYVMAISGTMTFEDALGRLLRGTGLGFQRNADGGYAVFRAAPAKVAISIPISPVAQMAQPALSEALDTGIEDIVVTAQRRDERLQSVPIAINALTSEGLERQGATRLTDISTLVPSLIFSRAGDSAQVYLRGIGTSSTTTGNAATIASYIDGVYVVSANSMLFSLNNIKRIEVLKGPQGTLFGRNATGGLTHVITGDPGPGTSGKISVGYGNYDTFNGGMYLSAGNNEIAGDISVTYNHQDKGWGRNVFSPQSAGTVLVSGQPVTLPDFNRRAGALDELGIRSKFVMTPNERTKIKISGMYSKLKSDQGLYRHGVYGSILSGNGVVPYVYNSGFYNYDSDAPWIGRNQSYLASSEASYEADMIDIKSITSYQKVSSYVFFPVDGTPIVNSSQASTKRSTRAFTQELQILSNGGFGPAWLEYTAGLYYINIDARDDGNRVVRGYFLQDLNERIASQKTDGIAAYGQATLSLARDTRLTLGLRYSQDRLEAQQYTVGLDVTTIPLPALADRPGQLSRLVQPQKDTFRKLTWRIALDHRLTAGMLIYASFNRGFKAGQFNVGSMCTVNLVGTACPQQNIAPPVKPEVLDAYEVGLKSDLLDRRLRLNLSGFYYDYSNLQVTTLITPPPIALLTNAGKAEIYGGEAEIIGALTPKFTLNANIGVLNAKYKSFSSAIVTVPRLVAPYNNVTTNIDASGNRLERSPKFTSSLGANWEVDTGLGTLNLNASWAHNSGFFWEASNRVKQPAYDVVNMETSLVLPGKDWKFRLWAKNLLGEKYYSNVSAAGSGDQGSPAAPRTYGVAAEWKF